jgi:alpha-mannosidase
MSQIHVIAHTHWDQEWYFTRQDSMVLASITLRMSSTRWSRTRLMLLSP